MNTKLRRVAALCWMLAAAPAHAQLSAHLYNFYKTHLSLETRQNAKQKRLDGKLAEAVYNNDIPAVKKLLEKGASIYAQNENGWPIIESVISKNNLKMVQAVIDTVGIEFDDTRSERYLRYAIQASGMFDDTALFDALIAAGAKPTAPTLLTAAGARFAILDRLISLGIDVNQTTGKHGTTPLLYAAQTTYNYHDSFRVQIIQKLIAAGANVDARDVTGKTALHYAALYNHKDTTKTLVAAGADVNAANMFGTTPLRIAQNRNRPEIAQTLLDAGAKHKPVSIPEEYDVNTRHFNDETALMWAAFEADVELFDNLVEAGANIRAVSRDDYAPSVFMCAAYGGNVEILRKLIQAGIDINEKGSFRMTALMIAAQHGHVDAVRLLLDSGVEDIEVKSRVGYTALFYAVSMADNEAIVVMLLDAGADVNTRDNAESTPLISAKSAAVMRHLIRKGADVNAQDRSGNTAMNRAKLLNRHDIIELLRSAGAKEE